MISLPSKQPTLCVTVPVRKKRRISYLSSVAVAEEASSPPPRRLLFQQSPPRSARRRLVVAAATVESTPSFIAPHRLFFAPTPPPLQGRRQAAAVEETITPQRLLYRDGNDGSCLSYPPVLRLCSNMTGDLSRLSDRRLCPRSDTIGGTDVGDLSRPSNRILCPHPRFGMGAATPVLAVTESLNAPNSVNNDNDEDVCDHEYNREKHAKKMKKDFCQSTSQELLAWKKKNALSTKKNLSKAPQNIQDSWEKIKQICDDCLSNKLDVWVDRTYLYYH